MQEEGARTAGRRREPGLALLTLTLLATAVGTALVCVALLSSHWEHISWDRSTVQHLAVSGNLTGLQVTVEWYLEGRLTHISIRSYQQISEIGGPELASLYLVPMHGGIWSLCLDLTDEEKKLVKRLGLEETDCISYLSDEEEVAEGTMARLARLNDGWHQRMQNLSISCALVCLIMIGSSGLVGAFGLVKHQISAVLVTGVMYLLAATFALFTVAMTHLKRRPERETRGRDGEECWRQEGLRRDGLLLVRGRASPSLWLPYLAGRITTPAWSSDLAWPALALTATAALLWLLLARLMRFGRL